MQMQTPRGRKTLPRKLRPLRRKAFGPRPPTQGCLSRPYPTGHSEWDRTRDTLEKKRVDLLPRDDCIARRMGP